MLETPPDKIADSTTLAGISEIWTDLPPARQSQMRAALLNGGWRDACRDAVRHHRTHEIERWLRADGARSMVYDSISNYGPTRAVGDFLQRQARSHLRCAQAALAGNSAESDRHIREAAEITGFPVAFYANLLSFLRDEPPQECPRMPTVRLSVLLVQPDGEAILSQLRLVRRPNGTGSLYPDLPLSFVFRDEAFRAAEESARRYARSVSRAWKNRSDVVWALEGGMSGRRILAGSSLGGSFAVGLQLLFKTAMDATNVAITATVRPDGTFGEVSGIDSKAKCPELLAHGIETVVTWGQAPAGLSTESVRVRPTRNVSEAVSLIRSLHARKPRVVARRLSLAVLVLAALYLAAAAGAGKFAYSYSLRSGGRVFVSAGLPYYLAPRRDVDTGLTVRDIQPNAVEALGDDSVRWSNAPCKDCENRLLAAMVDSLDKARTLRRLGRDREALEVFRRLLRSRYSTTQGPAATEAVDIDPEMWREALSVLEPQFDAYTAQRCGGVVETGDAVISLDRSQGGRVAAGLLAVIRDCGNNCVNVPALLVLARAEPSERAYAEARLKSLTLDTDGRVRAEAATALFRLDESRADEALAVLAPLLLDPSKDTRDPAFIGVTDIGARYPDKLRRALDTLPSDYPGGIPADLTAMFNGQASPWKAAAIADLLTTRNMGTFRAAAASADDILLPSYDPVSTYSRFLGLRMSTLWPSGDGDGDRARTYLVEMRSQTADRWAVYRYACAYAIYFSTPPGQRNREAAVVRRMWRNEGDPAVKLALGLALEQFQGQDLPLTPET